MKLSLLAAAAVSVLALNANATTILWGNHDSLEIGAVLANPGAFDDFIKFSIPDSSNLSSTTVANNLTNVLGIDNGMVQLFQETSSGNTLVGQYSFDGTTGSTWHSFMSLGAGSYYYEITGNATGSQGGFYSITSTVAAVPEPESYALLLAGLGVVGSLYRRRKAG
jgi:hypothetical protein